VQKFANKEFKYKSFPRSGITVFGRSMSIGQKVCARPVK
jgi:hypothetical protein